MKPATKAELYAAIEAADVPDDAPVLLLLHTPVPRAGWLGHVRYDPTCGTLDLHDLGATSTSSGPIPIIPVQRTADEDAYPRECT
jgi:hypothetical protein